MKVHNLFITIRGGSNDDRADFATLVSAQARRLATRHELTVDIAGDVDDDGFGPAADPKPETP